MTQSVAEQREYLTLAVQIAGMDVAQIVLPDDRELQLDGLWVHYLDWGSDEKPVALFLHGGALTAHTWDLVCLALRDELHCLALDARGHGDSQWPDDGDYSLQAQVADVEAFVRELKLDQFILVGMSLGGITALRYAGFYSDKLKGLVIIDTGPDVVVSVGAQQIRAFLAGPSELDSVEEFVERAMEFNPARDPRLLRRSLLNNLRELPSGRWTWKYDPRLLGGWNERERAARQEALLEAVDRIVCPTLVVRGGRSTNFSDEQAERLARSLRNGRWCRVENAGHTVQGDNPRGLVEELRPFLAELGLG